MKAILKAAILGSFALLALSQNSSASWLPSILGGGRPGSESRADNEGQRPIVLAQATDPVVQMGQMQDEIRKLTGQVQDLNYQLLQMQEQMRQMQKDNEFRFERLEKKTGLAPSDSGGGQDHSQNMTQPSRNDQARAQPNISGGLPGVAMNSTGSTGGRARNDNGRGAPPSALGTMTLDASGNPVGMTIDQPGANASGSDVASLPSSSSPEDIYNAAYNNILNGKYRAAENGFSDYLNIYPKGPHAADAMFWLGESEFSQGHYDSAAKTFLNAHQKYPQAEKAPETLLKLGMALAALNNRDTACATYREVLKRYPRSSREVRQKVASEEKRAGCA